MDIKCTNLFSVNLDISDVVLKHRRDVDFRKLVFTENNEKTCFPTRSVPDNHQLLPNGCHLCWETGGVFFQEFVTSRLSKMNKRTVESQNYQQKKLFFAVVGDFTCHAVGTSQGTQSHFVIRLCILSRQTFELFVEITRAQDKSRTQCCT